MKLNLRPNQTWIGKNNKGEKQKQLNLAAMNIISGAFVPHSLDLVGTKTISCQLESKLVKQVSKIAAEYEISVQECLRQYLEKNKLIS